MAKRKTRLVEVPFAVRFGARRLSKRRGYALNRVFAAVSLGGGLWSVTHRQTGYSAGYVRSLRVARGLAIALVDAVPERHWSFTDANVVRGNTKFKNCFGIIRKFERLA